MPRKRILLTGNPSCEVLTCLNYYLRAQKLLPGDAELLFDGIDDRTDIDLSFGIEPCPEELTHLEYEATRHRFVPDALYVKLFREHKTHKRLVKKPYLNSFVYLGLTVYRDKPKSGKAAHDIRLRIVNRFLRVIDTFTEALAHPETAAALQGAEQALGTIDAYSRYVTMERGVTETDIMAYEDVGRSVATQAVQLAKQFPFSQGFRKATGRKHQGLPLPFTLAGYLTVLFLQGKNVQDEDWFFTPTFYEIREQVDRTKHALYVMAPERFKPFTIPSLQIRCAVVDIESDHDANNVFNDTKEGILITRDQREKIPSFAIMANTSDAAAVTLVEKAGLELQKRDPNGWTIQKGKGRMVVLVAKGIKRTPKDADMNTIIHMLMVLGDNV